MKIAYHGVSYDAITRADALARGIPEAVIAAAEAEALAAHERGLLRRRIAAEAGDTPSLLGTTADAAGMTLLELARLARSLSTAESLAEVRAAAQPLADLTANLLAATESGDVRWPHAAKGGAAAILPEIGQRATSVADFLIEDI